MNDLIKYFVKSLASSTLSLKKKGILVEKPWALLDDDGEIQKLIFKRDKGLILSKNGKVTEGSWDYYPEARALLVDRKQDKLLLQEQYVDENVLILKKDGTDNEFYALANENVIPDYNIPKYLNTVKCIELEISARRLLNGNIIQIHHAKDAYNYQSYRYHAVEQVDDKYNSVELKDGNYITANKELSFYIQGGRISEVTKNLLKKLPNGDTFEIEDGKSTFIKRNKKKKVTLNGKPIHDKRLVDEDNFIYIVNESRIAEVLKIREYKLKDGSTIKVEQKDFDEISKRDKIIDATPIYPIPDGKYKIKGRLIKIKVVDCEILRG